MTKTDYIDSVIQDFYTKAPKDIIIGYHFVHITHIQEHIVHIALFWRTQLLPGPWPKPKVPFALLKKHYELNVKKGQILRWRVLFFESMDEIIQKKSENRADPLLNDFAQNWKLRVNTLTENFLCDPKMSSFLPSPKG